jgi:hypothetical protein
MSRAFLFTEDPRPWRGMVMNSVYTSGIDSIHNYYHACIKAKLGVQSRSCSDQNIVHKIL